MFLEYVYIAGYKNLIDTELEFDECKFPVSIIGNNGTGKSNLIEALLHIFVGLYYNQPPSFDFSIRYVAYDKSVEVKKYGQERGFDITVDGLRWNANKFKERIRSPSQRPPFPAQVFTYYSGSCDRVASIVKKYNRSYMYKLRRYTDDLERQFVFSDVSQAEWIVLGLIAHGHQQLLREMGIGHLNELKLTFHSPKSYVSDDDPLFWGTVGAIREFLADVDNLAEEGYQPDSPFSRTSLRRLRTYRLNTDQLRRIGAALEKRGTTLYSLLQAMAARHMLWANEFDIVREGTTDHYKTEFLSEGEKQLLCVIGGLTLAKNNECLVLLDEPDTHLNPAWSWRYNSLLKRALTSQQQATSTTIIATHDPIMISGMTREQVFIAHNENNRLVYERPYRDPRGQGVANILVSEYFGLPSSLDEYTQSMLDERLQFAYRDEELTDDERERLQEINAYLDGLGLTISFRDPKYKAWEEQLYTHGEGEE